MSSNLLESTVLITSNNPDNDVFGTGFVVHHDGQATYVLTCAHVVRDLGGSETIKAASIKATVIALGSEDGISGIDLAVLRVEGLPGMPPLSLRSQGEKGKPFSTAGFQAYSKKQYLIRKLQGVLGEQVALGTNQANLVRAWDLKITDDFQLQPGYSGSAIVDQDGCVIGVVSMRQDQGKKGLAISIEALEMICSGTLSKVFAKEDVHNMLIEIAKAEILPLHKVDPSPVHASSSPQRKALTEITTRDRHKLVDLLYACDTMYRNESREIVVKDLHNKMKGPILRDNQNAKLDVRLLLDSCLNYPGRLEELIDILKYYEGYDEEHNEEGTKQVQKVIRFVEELLAR